MRATVRGFTLVELLAAVALIGLIAMTATGIVSILLTAIDEDAFQMPRSEQQLLAVRHLRMAARRASSARVRVFNGALVLEGDGVDGSQWCVREAQLRVFPPDYQGTCDRGVMRIEKHPGGDLIVADIATYGPVVMRVGGDRR